MTFPLDTATIRIGLSDPRGSRAAKSELDAV
jgi:hypothetical protein